MQDATPASPGIRAIRPWPAGACLASTIPSPGEQLSNEERPALPLTRRALASLACLRGFTAGRAGRRNRIACQSRIVGSPDFRVLEASRALVRAENHPFLAEPASAGSSSFS